MPDQAHLTASTLEARGFLTFRVDGRLYALPTELVSEVIRVPALARLPQGPAALLGLANLRGAVLPVASAHGLLGRARPGLAAAARGIVLDGATPAALAVDAIEGLVTVAASKIETRQTELAAEAGEDVVGAFATDPEGEVARILDVHRLLAAAFVQRRAPQTAPSLVAAVTGRAEAGADAVREQYVTFEIADQEYGLPLGAVREVISAPDVAAQVPHSESVVVGVMAYRDTLLPLLSLRGLLGFPAVPGAGKVVVTRVGGVLVGLVADRMRAILAPDPQRVEPIPPMLAARTGGEAQVVSIYRGEAGRGLVSLLAPDQLFREDVMQRLGEAREPTLEAEGDMGHDGAERKFLVFRLGDNEFALPIESVDEVARVPDQITRVPKAPKFLAGVINLRGEVLPVVDQRRRFDLPPLASPEGRRLIVLRTGQRRAGVIVDSVSEVLQCGPKDIGEAPDLAGESTRLVEGVINLTAAGRMVLLLDPAELLTRTERGLLDAFRPQPGQAGG